jgi:hypothetical protein
MKPLADLPNMAGFRFRGVLKDQTLVECVTERGPDGCYRIAVGMYPELIGWFL